GRVVDGSMTVGTLVAFLALYQRFVNRGFRVPQLVNSVQSGGAAYARLRPLLAPALPVAGEPPFASLRTGHVAGVEQGPPPPRASATCPRTPTSSRGRSARTSCSTRRAATGRST